MFPLLLAAITVTTGFEGGSIGRIEQVSAAHLRLGAAGESDQDKRNRQANWYYFRLDGLPKSELTIDLVDLVGEYNYRPGAHSVTRNSRPVYSYDNRTWRHFSDQQVSWDEKEIRLTLRFRPERPRLWIAHVAPYTARHLAALLTEVGKHPHLKREVIGKTVGGRDMLLLTVTNPAVADAGKKVIWLMARQHAWETGTSYVAEGALRYLVSGAAQASGIRDTRVFKIFPMADPDGVARGGVRFNTHGYDLNRNWDAVDPVKMPEIAAQRKAILDWVDSGRRIDLFLALHNTEGADFIEAPLEAGGAELQNLARRFHDLLVARTTFYSPKGPRSSGLSTTPGRKGRMTVYQGLFHERRIPAFLMEQMVEHSPKLGRPPTVEDRLEFGAALAGVLSAAVE